MGAESAMNSHQVEQYPTDPAKLQFFAESRYSLTYDDVLLEGVGPHIGSRVTAATADTQTWFSENVPLNTPFVTAAMDTVTGPAMARAAAEEGGIGVIPAVGTVEEQLEDIKKVRYGMGGAVDKVRTIKETQTLAEVLEWREEKEYDFGSFPVENEDERFVGLVTSDIFEIFSRNRDVLIRDMMIPKDEVTTTAADSEAAFVLKLMQLNRKKHIPMVDEEDRVQGMFVWKDIDHALNLDVGIINTTPDGKLRVAAAISTHEGWEERVEAIGPYVDAIVVDTARGQSGYVQDVIEALVAMPGRKFDVVGGNISDAPSAKTLLDWGAQGVKVGQGPGSICTTRVNTGFGKPQLSAIFECAQAIKGSGMPVIGDGGIVHPGDFPKALAAGAWSVMSGGRYAGCDEAPNSTVTINGVTYHEYDGAASAPAMARNSGRSKHRYLLSDKSKLTEGVPSLVPTNGSVHDVMQFDRQAIQQGMAYVGAPDIPSLQAKTTFIAVTPAGITENHPHNVRVREG
jgi:IMP dehydrogenase